MNTLPLWKRCRALANGLRLDMLELLHRSPNRCVKAIAADLGVAGDVASKHLQLLYSAGFVTRKHQGKYLYYSLSHEDGLLAGVLELAMGPKKDQVIFMATALTHERRIAIIKALSLGPLDFEKLILTTRISWGAMKRHLDKLVRRGFVKNPGREYILETPKCTLGQRMVELALRDSTPAQV